jgi:hypothetical protein
LVSVVEDVVFGSFVAQHRLAVRKDGTSVGIPTVENILSDFDVDNKAEAPGPAQRHRLVSTSNATLGRFMMITDSNQVYCVSFVFLRSFYDGILAQKKLDVLFLSLVTSVN